MCETIPVDSGKGSFFFFEKKKKRENYCCVLTGAVRNDGGAAVHVVRDLAATHLPRLVLRLPETAVRTPRAHQSDSAPGARAAVVPRPLLRVSSDSLSLSLSLSFGVTLTLNSCEVTMVLKSNTELVQFCAWA